MPKQYGTDDHRPERAVTVRAWVLTVNGEDPEVDVDAVAWTTRAVRIRFVDRSATSTTRRCGWARLPGGERPGRWVGRAAQSSPEMYAPAPIDPHVPLSSAGTVSRSSVQPPCSSNPTVPSIASLNSRARASMGSTDCEAAALERREL
jgi:hypothetical protein